MAGVQLRLLRLPRGTELLYVRSHVAALPASLWARLRRIPVVQEVNGTAEDYFQAWPQLRPLGKLVRWSINAQLRWATTVVAVTPSLGEWVAASSGNDAVVIIPNGANTDRFRPDLPRPDSLPPRYVSFVGAFAPWQGVGDIVGATYHPAWPDDVAAVFVGEGREAGVVRRAASRRPGRIRLLGSLRYESVAAVVANSVAALAPAREREGSGVAPLKVFEAMACGVPVIVGAVPCIAEVVRRAGCGLVVPTGNVEALARGVARLAGDPELAGSLGAAGRREAERAQSWHHRARALDTVLRAARTGRGVVRDDRSGALGHL